jgi:hypothetical protein
MDIQKIYDRLNEAIDYADDLCANYTGKPATIPDDVKVILEEYVDKGIITWAKAKKGKLSKEIYYPSLMAAEMDGIAMRAWLYILQDAMQKHDIKNGLGENSAREYIGRPHQYIPEAAGDPDFVTSVWKHSELGIETDYQLELLKHMIDRGEGTRKPKVKEEITQFLTK